MSAFHPKQTLGTASHATPRSYVAAMGANRLNEKLVEGWRSAAVDLGIRVTAPVELSDRDGAKFQCEALIHDFGSPNGAVVVSRRTERRVREGLRGLGPSVWVCIAPDRQPSEYARKRFIDQLVDWGWFGDPARRPDWFSGRG